MNKNYNKKALKLMKIAMKYLMIKQRKMIITIKVVLILITKCF